MNGGCALESDPFWGHNGIRKNLLKYRFEEHSACHCSSCFEKGCKCRFLFPFMSTLSTYLHEDRGDNNNNETLWFCLNGSINSVYPFMVIPKRPMGCQFINAHNKPISEVFDFNTNIQIGDALQVFYFTLYTSESTQDEVNKKQLPIGRAVIKIIKHLLDENQTNGCDQTKSEPSFGEGLSRILLGLNAATTRNVICSTMAHLISCNNGSWFAFSHEFSDLLVGRIEATLEGQYINVRIRTSKVPAGELKCWPDSLADDYIHRPLQKEFEDICFYYMTSQYKKIYKSYKPKSIQTYEFSYSHPGYKFSHLSKLKHSTIPRIALPKNKLPMFPGRT